MVRVDERSDFGAEELETSLAVDLPTDDEAEGGADQDVIQVMRSGVQPLKRHGSGHE